MHLKPENIGCEKMLMNFQKESIKILEFIIDFFCTPCNQSNNVK